MFSPKGEVADLLLSFLTKMLNIDSLHHFLAISHAGLLESLTATKFFYDTCSFKFAFESLESSLDILAFFNLYD